MILYNHSLHLFNFGKKDRGGYSNNKKVDMRHLERVFFLLSKKKKKKKGNPNTPFKSVTAGPRTQESKQGASSSKCKEALILRVVQVQGLST